MTKKVEITGISTQCSNFRHTLILTHAILPVKLINTSARLRRLLLSCIERMAFGTDFNVNVLLRRSRHECIAAVARYRRLMVIWMDSFSHTFHLSLDLS